MDKKTEKLIEETQRNGCKCQECGRYYKVDFNIPKEIWVKMCGKYNLLCGCCIVKRLEQLEEWDYWNIVKLDQFNLNDINLVDKAAMFLERAFVSGDTMVEMDHNLENLPKDIDGGSVYLHDLFTNFVEEIIEAIVVKSAAVKNRS